MAVAINGIIPVLALLLAIGATVVAFIFIVPAKKREKLNKIGKIAHDALNFKYLIVEKVLQALYIFSTAFVIVLGFFMLFYFERYYYGDVKWHGGEGLLLMILGPIAVRLAYEFMMMLILLVKNVIQINNKLKAETDTQEADVFAVPAEELFQKPQAAVCPVCGNEVGDAAFCCKCGNKVK